MIQRHHHRSPIPEVVQMLQNLQSLVPVFLVFHLHQIMKRPQILAQIITTNLLGPTSTYSAMVHLKPTVAFGRKGICLSNNR